MWRERGEKKKICSRRDASVRLGSARLRSARSTENFQSAFRVSAFEEGGRGREGGMSVFASPCQRTPAVLSEKRINMHEDHLYGRRSRFHATRLCHTRPIQSRARIHTYVHTHTRTRRTLQPIPSSSHPPLLSLFYGHVINILSTRGGQNFDSFFFFFSVSFSLSLFLCPSVHPPFPSFAR